MAGVSDDFPDDVELTGVRVRMRELITDVDFLDVCKTAKVNVFEAAVRVCIAYGECHERNVDARHLHRHFANFLAMPSLYAQLEADGYLHTDEEGVQWVLFGGLVMPGMDLPDYYFMPAFGGR